MEKPGVPMHQFPQSPEMPHPQPPGYVQDPNQHAHYQHQHQHQPMHPGSPPPMQAGSPPPMQGQMHPGSPQPQMYPPGTFVSSQPTSPYQQPPVNPGMPPQQPSGTTYHNVTPLASLGRGPAPVDCPACAQRALTNVSYEIGNTTHGWALGLCCLTCLGCIPYLLNSLKDVVHKCGRCGVLLATYHRSGTTEVHIHG